MNRIEAFDARGLGVKLLLATPNKLSKNWSGTDERAAILARHDGIDCAETPPYNGERGSISL